MKNFVFRTGPNLVFGDKGFDALYEFIRFRGISRIGLITGKHSFRNTPEWSELTGRISSLGVDMSFAAVSGEPSPAVVDSITRDFQKEGVEGVCAVGGGSVLDAGKAVSAMIGEGGKQSVTEYLEGVGTLIPSGKKLPFAAVPTTAGTGSEATKNAVISEVGSRGFKKSLRHDQYIPDIAVIVPRLYCNCSPYLTAASGLDAVSQLIEGYLSLASSSYSDALALQGLVHAFRSLRPLVSGKESAELRGEMALAAHYSGIVLANAGLCAVHGLASPVGGGFPIPHGVVCARLLPRFLEILMQHDSLPEETAAKLRILTELFTNNVEGFSGEENAGIAPLIIWILDITEAGALEPFSHWGLTREKIRSLAEQSGQKNTPVDFSTEDMVSMIESAS